MRRLTRFFARCFIVVLLATSVTVASPGPSNAAVDWQADPRHPVYYHLLAVAYGGGRFVAVGEHGTILNSEDGEQWSRADSTSSDDLNGVAYGNGTFMVIGPRDAEGHAWVLLSTDGVEWRRQAAPRLMGAIAYCDGQFFASAFWPAGLYRSPDGTTWTTEPFPDPQTLLQPTAIACGGGRVVTVTLGERSDPFVASWSEQTGWTRWALMPSTEILDVEYGGGQFEMLTREAMIDHPGTVVGAAYTSPDGVMWTRSPQVLHTVPANLVYTGDRWVAGSATSTDGVDWTEDTGGFAGPAAYGAGTFVGIGPYGTTARSANGHDWTSVPIRLDEDMAFGAGHFVSVGYEGSNDSNLTGVVSTSADGLIWQRRTLPRPWVPRQVFYDGARFVAVASDLTTVGDSRAIFTSPNGEEWQQAGPPPDHTVQVIWAGDRYVAVTSDLQALPGDGLWKDQPGRVMFSADLTTWTEAASLPGQLRRITYGNGTYVVTANEFNPDGGRWIAGPPQREFQYTSNDGQVWTRRDVALGPMIFCNGQFMTGWGRASRDGVTWLDPAPGAPGGWNLTCGDGYVLGSAGRDSLYASRDGQSWGQLEPPLGVEIRAIAFANGRLVATGLGQAASTPRCPGLLDVAADDPACKAVPTLIARQVMTGFPGGLIKPEATLTRAELAKMVVAALGGAPLPNGDLLFTDTLGHWGATQGWVQAAVAMGAISGYPDGTFRPNAPVTRAELIKMTASAAGLAAAPGALPYGDEAGEDWYSGWVRAALNANLIGPMGAVPIWPEGNLSANTLVKRGEASVVLFNLLQWLGNPHVRP